MDTTRRYHSTQPEVVVLSFEKNFHAFRFSEIFLLKHSYKVPVFVFPTRSLGSMKSLEFRTLGFRFAFYLRVTAIIRLS